MLSGFKRFKRFKQFKRFNQEAGGFLAARLFASALMDGIRPWVLKQRRPTPYDALPCGRPG
jgi:hypothetical protein